MRRQGSGEVVERCRAISALTDPISSCTLSRLASSASIIEWSNQSLQRARVYSSSGAEISRRKYLARCENELAEVKLFGWLT